MIKTRDSYIRIAFGGQGLKNGLHFLGIWFGECFERAVKYDQDAGTIASGHLPSWSSDGEVRKPSFYHFSKETCPPE